MDQNSDEVEEPGDTAMTSTVSEVKEDEKEEIIIPRLEDLPSYSVDDFGFLNNSDTKSNNIRVIHSVKQYRQLESQWVAILNNWDEYRNNNFDRIKNLCRIGLPEGVRAKVWQKLAYCDEVKSQNQQLDFKDLVARPILPIYDVIERDINRCYPDHFFFREKQSQGQKDLSDILKAFAQYNPEVGYCQGMGRVAGMILMQMPVEEAFWLMVATMDKFMEGFYKESLDRLRIHATVFESLLHKYLPKLARYLDKCDISPLIYVTPWFLTLYTMVLPWQTVLRVWDMFYCEGLKVLHRIGLGILRITQNEILMCQSPSDVMDFLLHVPHQYLDADRLIRTSLKIGLSRQEIIDLEDKATKLWEKQPPQRGTVTLVRNNK